MSLIDEQRFEILSNLWCSQTESALFHLRIGVQIVSEQSKISKELYELEQKLGLKRKQPKEKQS